MPGFEFFWRKSCHFPLSTSNCFLLLRGACLPAVFLHILYATTLPAHSSPIFQLGAKITNGTRKILRVDFHVTVGICWWARKATWRMPCSLCWASLSWLDSWEINTLSTSGCSGAKSTHTMRQRRRRPQTEQLRCGQTLLVKKHWLKQYDVWSRKNRQIAERQGQEIEFQNSKTLDRSIQQDGRQRRRRSLSRYAGRMELAKGCQLLSVVLEKRMRKWGQQ